MLPDRHHRPSSYERRYIVVVAALVLVFVIVGVAMSFFQPISAPLPIDEESVAVYNTVQPDTASAHKQQKRGGKQAKGDGQKSSKSRKQTGKSADKQSPTREAPLPPPVHSEPIPTD